MRTHYHLILLSLLTFNSFFISAQFWSIDSLKIIPPNPNTFDTIKVISKLQFPTSYCFHISSSVNINGFDIIIDDIHPVGNLQAFCYAKDTITLGNNFDVGNYCVFYSLRDTSFNLLDADTICFSILPNGLQEYNNVEIKFYPNPVTDIATVSLNSFESSSVYQLELFSPEGKLIFKEAIRNKDYIFNRNGLASGIYFYLIRKDEAVIFREKVCIK